LVPRRIIRIYRDSLTNQERSFTEKRNYNTHSRGLNEILRLKYPCSPGKPRDGRAGWCL